jgi:thiosulfate/3-mercaptopyruvate sulfurtransferase
VTDLRTPDPAAQHPLLVTIGWLAEHLEDPELCLIDAGEAVAYRRAHLPGAVGVPHPYLKGDGGKLVMDAEEFEALARRWGVSPDSPVVIYDDNASLHAARVWWVFRLYGHQHVRVLDGGFNAWLDEGRPLTSAPGRPEPGAFEARLDPSQLCTMDELRAELDSDIAIWDTRADDEWEGTNSRGNARVGRVPGAVHLEWRHLMQGPPARRFRPLDEIRTAFLEAGLDPDAPTISYCQAGIRGAFGTFILALMGNDRARNYDGSMGEWANVEDTPLVLE